MKCRKHEWSALMRKPADALEACAFVLYQYGRYVRCQHCGVIGRVIHSRRSGIRPLTSFGQQRWQEKADHWNTTKSEEV